MTKAELVDKMALAAGITKIAAEKALGGFIDAVVAAVKADEKVTLVGFGTFSAVTRAARTGRNPQTGNAINIEEKTNGKFTPGKNLKDLKEKPAPKEEKPAPKEEKPATKEEKPATKAKAAAKKK